MADDVFNISLAEVKAMCELPAAADALVIVLVETAGIEADDVLNNYDDLAALLAAANNEQTTMGRKTISAAIVITVDDTNNRVDIDFPDQTYTGATGNAVSKALVTYDPDTGAGTDSSIVLLTFHDFVISPDGSDVTLQTGANGFFRAS